MKKCLDCQSTDGPFSGRRCTTCFNKRVYQRRKERGLTTHDLQSSEEMRDRNRSYNLRLKYGITDNDCFDLLQKQDNKCAICLTTFPITPEGKGRSSFAVDHDHDTGRVRGLLCHPCNRGLGHFKDDVERLRNAVVYLEMPNQVH